MKKLFFQLAKYIVFGLLYCSGASTLYRIFTKHRMRILCYHRISEKPSDPLLDVTLERFRAQMRYLKRCYIPVPLSCGLDLLEKPESHSVMPHVAVTFDDGTKDWLSLALPALDEMQVPAEFFVCTGYIGNGEIPYPNRHTPSLALTLEELRRLAASPFVALGGHTMNHPHLSRLNAEDAFREINGSRAQLQEWCATPVEMFAYPFGDDPEYTEETMRVTRDAGFRAAFTLDERTCRAGDDFYSLPRLVIFDEPLWMFKVRVSGILDDVLSVFRKPKRIAYQDIKSSKAKTARAKASPTVSIVIRTKNKGEMLRKALECVRRQTFSDWEALILDDGSTDDTPSIAASFYQHDKRFRYIRNSPPLGKTRNCNYGLHLARGEFIAMLDGDDYWSDPEKLTRQVARMRQDPALTVSAGGVLKIDVAGRGRTHAVPNTWNSDLEIRSSLMIENMIPHSAVMFRRSEALRVGGYEERFLLSEDFDLFLKLGRRGKFHMDDRTYCHYHLHEENATDVQKMRQLIATLRILIRHAGVYPHALRGIIHVSLRLMASCMPLHMKNKIASLLQYRDRRYRYMEQLSGK